MPAVVCVYKWVLPSVASDEKLGGPGNEGTKIQSCRNSFDLYKIVCTCMCGKNLLQNPSYEKRNNEGKMKAYLGGVLLFLYIVTTSEGMCSSI